MHTAASTPPALGLCPASPFRVSRKPRPQMTQMSFDPTSLTTLRRTGEAKVFRVESVGLLGWMIYLVGDPKAYGLSTQRLATAHAQKLARENRPSVVVAVDVSGNVIQCWEFPAADQTSAGGPEA